MQEMLDTYDINGKLLGVKSRDYCHNGNPYCYHKAVWIWIINDKGEILVQKRSALKKNSPNKYDISVAGHVDAGETLLQACVRETKEELGITSSEKDFMFLKEILNKDGWEFGENYVLLTDCKIEKMKLQSEEIEKVKFLKYEDFAKLIYSDKFCDQSKEYKDWICKVLEEIVESFKIKNL